MILSDEQTGAARLRADVTDWTMVDIPVGPQPIPSWVTGMAVRWMDGYGNNPTCAIRVTEDARTWPDKVFQQSGDRYLARSGDGRAECYYHSGALRPTKLRRWQRADGSFVRGAYISPEIIAAGGEWGEWEVLATPQEEGFGGSHYEIMLTDGREVVLRGPWHGPCPLGFQELAYINVNARWATRGGDWTKRGGIGGLLIEDDLFIRLFARFLPHLTLARVGKFLQPVKPEWDAPKHVIQAREYDARQAAQARLG